MKKVYTIGRDPQSDIVINDSSDVVSRLHATIRIEGSKMFLIDQSQNGTYVNGMRMSANEEIPVTMEDTISFANVAELDWALLPNPKKAQIRTIGIVAATLIAIATMVFCILFFIDHKGNTTIEEPSATITIKPDTTTTKADDENTVKTDTTPVKTVATPKEVTPSNPAGGKKKGGNKEKGEEQSKENKQETPNPENDIPLY